MREDARGATDPNRTSRGIRTRAAGAGRWSGEREQVARRGQRLDESKPGSGLGLSIVLELATLYGGGLTLWNAPIGGLRAELVLPAV
jgi:K+-sensing histidine kinase KdpD